MRHVVGVGLSLTALRYAPASGPPPPASITLDATASGGTASGSSLSVAHTVGALSTYGILIVEIQYRDPNFIGNDVTGITYAGRALTPVPGAQIGSDPAVNVWYLLNPPAGTDNVVVSATGNLTMTVFVSSWDGVKKTSTFGSVVIANGNTNASTAAVTFAATSALVCSHGQTNGSTNVSATPVSPLQGFASVFVGTSPNRFLGRGCHVLPGDSDPNPTINLSAVKPWALSCVELKAAAA